MNTRLFINEIKNRRALWDQSDQNYHNKKVLHDQWLEVATIFDIEVSTAKQKWKNLRDTFRVELKKNRKYSVSETPETLNKSQWSYYEDMLFIKDILKTRKLRDLLEPGMSNPDEFMDGSGETIKIEPDMSFSPIRLTENAEENKPTFENISPLQPQIQDIDTTNNYPYRRGLKRRFDEEDIKTENNDEGQDDDLLFFRSVLPFVKRLDQDKKLLFRMNVQQILYNHLYNNN
ncbi:uncharacterized protein BDFB_004026 [Asbolus verrucosus]|uniref:Transcription factor Adf-1 n=1 Tax=Asbolus verrucosus TaxID=1661398 RepID=A0A482W7L6_ASBVE|nr:uncharacterized protein BDFB_004026 [Asbolus verrucosus]